MKYLLILLSLVFSFSMGCGAHASYDLGIPVSKSESFFFHMKEAAANAGYRSSTNEQGDLAVYVPEGTLRYSPNSSGDGLAVRLSTKAHDDSSVEAEWLEALERTHDRLLADAKALSKKNQAW